MVHIRIHIGIKAVFIRCGFVPSGGGLFVGETNFHNALGIFKTVFPRHVQTHGGTVLFGQHLAIQTKGEQRERVHGLVHAQAFHVGPTQHPRAHIGHGFRIGQGDELDELGAAQGLDPFDQFRQRITHPRHHHRPAFNTAHAVDALFHGADFEQVFQVDATRFFHHAFNLDTPR